MPRDGDPRVMVRLSPELAEALAESAQAANVAVAALVRECAERHHESVARDVREGRVRLRRGSVEAVKPQVVRASSLVGPSALALERQRRLNVSAERARKPGK